ncbi:Hypothetical protein CpOVID04_0791 [Corynebacterium pseudotuberculosis]|nr:Hypothetical protein CpPAT10_1871 [Corynebacterium pseudotuberculosis PAT10]AFF23016.1 Hypothetical protein CpP54B96_1898 [Corynebacterium pseudotuberculosis P54B96]AIG06081.1 hypothetical protein CPTA_00252 [Corynebacterium pseudotuberculosis]AIG09334.1 hypothetical protein CPTB_01278 [Corynebacterium pseudotuberculosis]AIG11234.1 hypothetical protein CPTC_00946 [Corynebacterium pseudotuberculosis]
MSLFKQDAPGPRWLKMTHSYFLILGKRKNHVVLHKLLGKGIGYRVASV